MPADSINPASHKKTGAAFWATVVLVVALVAYLLSFGPACWLCKRAILPQRTAWVLFRPSTWLAVHGPYPLRAVIRRYAGLFGDESRAFAMHVEQFGVTEFTYHGPGRSTSPIDYEVRHRWEN